MDLLRPNFRTCDDCEKYLYEGDNTVSTRRGPGGKPLPVLRPPGVPTPCQGCPKIPSSVPGPERHRGHAMEHSRRIRKAYEFYRQCRAVGSFPDDDVVRWVARVCYEVEDEVKRLQWKGFLKRVGVELK
jgi:hypothetical protein